MNKPVQIGRTFYGIAMVVYGIQQIFYGNFRSVQLPAWQSHIPWLSVWATITGIGVACAGAAIIFDKNGRTVSLYLGGIFLFLFLFVHIPFEIYGEVNSSTHLALWTNALKELALSGGAFVMAGSFIEDISRKSGAVRFLEKFNPLGSVFFSITMISFGIMHFMYSEFVSSLVPDWFPDHLFWTYFSAVALICSGVSIILKIRTGAVAILLSIMLLLWVILLHVPRAIASPFEARGNELSSVFDALAFCGIAFVISLRNFRSDFNEIMKP
ncbi:MAG: hypothetical protein C0490_08925 [Marivirga sp.]|nr:hypothetical protein [Marivirga sp.]